MTNNSWNSQNPAQVAKGGTGKSSFTELNQIIISPGLNSPLIQIPGGQLNYVLTSNGTNVAPTWQPVGNIQSVNLVYTRLTHDITTTNRYLLADFDEVLIDDNDCWTPNWYTVKINGYYSVFAYLKLANLAPVNFQANTITGKPQTLESSGHLYLTYDVVIPANTLMPQISWATITDFDTYTSSKTLLAGSYAVIYFLRSI